MVFWWEARRWRAVHHAVDNTEITSLVYVHNCFENLWVEMNDFCGWILAGSFRPDKSIQVKESVFCVVGKEKSVRAEKLFVLKFTWWPARRHSQQLPVLRILDYEYKKRYLCGINTRLRRMVWCDKMTQMATSPLRYIICHAVNAMVRREKR